MVKLRPLGKARATAFQIENQWQGFLLFSLENGAFTKDCPTGGLQDTRELAQENAESVLKRIPQRGSGFDFNGYTFDLESVPWQGGARGKVTMFRRGDTGGILSPSVELLCGTYQETYEEALHEAFTESVRVIHSGVICRLLDKRIGTIEEE